MRSRYLVISPILLGRLSRNRMDGPYHKYLCNYRYNRKSTASAWFIPCVRLQVIVANVKERKNILNPQNLLFLSLFEASTTAVLSVRCRKNSTHKSLRQNPCHKHMRLQNMIAQLYPPSVPITITPVGGEGALIAVRHGDTYPSPV